MTFNKPRFSRKHKWELMRFCSLKNTVVIGGFSKLLKHFNQDSIVTYADRTYSDGSVYEKNGFRKIKVNRPNFWYVDITNEKRFNRMKFQKSKLFPESKMSGNEIMDLLGYKKIWNCGTISYEYGTK